MDKAGIHTELGSLCSQIHTGDLWCIKKLLDNGLTTTDMLKGAIIMSDTHINGQGIPMPLCDFLLDLFDLDHRTITTILNRVNSREAKNNPSEFIKRIFKYEHEGPIDPRLFLELPLESFLEYVQMKDIDINTLHTCVKWVGRSEVVDWIASNRRLDSPQCIIDVHNTKNMTIHNSPPLETSCIFLERLFTEFPGHALTQKTINAVMKEIVHRCINIGCYDGGKVSRAIEIIVENGYFITNMKLARSLIIEYRGKMPEIESGISPEILEQIKKNPKKTVPK